MRIVIFFMVFMTACGPWALRTGTRTPEPPSRAPRAVPAPPPRGGYAENIRQLVLRRTDLAMDQSLVLSLIDQARNDGNPKAERMLWEKYRALEREKKKVDLEFLRLQEERGTGEAPQVAWLSAAN